MHPIQEPYSMVNEDDGLEGIMRTWCWVGVGLWIIVESLASLGWYCMIFLVD